MYRRPDGKAGGFDGGNRPDYRHVAPPSDINRRKKGYTPVEEQSVGLSSTIARQKRVRLDDEYFDDDDENNEVVLSDDEGRKETGGRVRRKLKEG